eukprot:CAMPEP_0179456956 /NCGR_PEP_ID=MMETSP0799-20121207/40819_1 /TAXON_ID=46947 /ORGANISM="Geminigera cryophila, Strain CCMP2564" /LENGTH=130 /DNA_ID=CAMNT_0021257351 /DNA_START=49 /DNA_END=441 /DNA_ORIENTATION=+
MADLLSEEKLAEFNDAFSAFDKKGEKKIPSSDLITVFQAMRCNISKKEETDYLSLLDPYGEGSVPYAEMLPLIAKRLETKETTDALVSAFRVFDKQNRGNSACVLPPTYLYMYMHMYIYVYTIYTYLYYD